MVATIMAARITRCDLDIPHLRFGCFQRPPDTILRLSLIDQTIRVLGFFFLIENDFVEAVFIYRHYHTSLREYFALRKIYFVADDWIKTRIFLQ